jgi:hypothetical protein
VNNTLHSQIRRHLGNDRAPTCDSCLALRFHESLEDTRAAAMLLVREDGFMRKGGVCDGCRRTVEMTHVMR